MSGEGEACNEGAVNGFAFLRGAASGDLGSMRSLVSLGMAQTADEPDILTLTETLVFARMAAVVGDLNDTATLLSVLGVTIMLLEGQEQWSEYRDQLQGEGIAIASQLADAGVEIADQFLPCMVEDAGPQAAAIAKDFAVRMAAI
jgi:hypothetical protein